MRQETSAQRLRRLQRQREYNRRRRVNRDDAPMHEQHEDDSTHREVTNRNDSSSDCQVERCDPDMLESREHRERRLARQRTYNNRRRQLQRDIDAETSSSIRETVEEQKRRLDQQRLYDRARAVRLRATDRTNTHMSLAPPRHELTNSTELSHETSASARTSARETGNELLGEISQLSSGNIAGFSTRSNYSTEYLNVEVGGENLAPLSQNDIITIEKRLVAALGAEGLDESVCAVCDRLTLRTKLRSVYQSDSRLFESMRVCLAIPDLDLPTLLVHQYDCGNIDGILSGMMLSSKGVKKTAGITCITMCDDCHSDLTKGRSTPPKFSIANGFYVGLLPDELFVATWIEKLMTQLVTVVAQTRIMRGGRHRAIRSHCMVFDASPGPPATLLPRRIDQNGPYRVILAGSMTAQQSDRVKKLHEVRGAMVADLLSFFKRHNKLYATIEIGESVSQHNGTTNLDSILIVDPDPTIVSEIDDDQDGVARHNIAALSIEDECNVIEQNVLLSDECILANTAYVQRVVDLNAQEPLLVPKLLVNHSSYFSTSDCIEAKMHSHLFPFGRGHPDETRKTHVSKIDCIKYYAMLSSRRFSQDQTFLLTAFARLSLENMYKMTTVKCRRYSHILEGYQNLSCAEIASALVNNERRQRGEPCRNIPNPTAERFLKSVELGSVSVWGSSAERRQCRQEAFAYQTRFGQPSLFVTITPNTDHSYAMAHYAGILSVDSLFDILEARVPSTNEMKTATMQDDGALACLFMRTVDAFIKNVLGIDPVTSKQQDVGGLFGKTRAYFGMVETQGRGTLHIHFLIWLVGTPMNSRVFDEKFLNDGDAFKQRVEQFVDSIVTTRFPATTDISCPNCHSTGQLNSLPIPAKSRQNRKKRDENIALEPLLIKCEACDWKCSSQHILRQALLTQRPPHWPPPLMPLSAKCQAERIHSEVPARSSKSATTTRFEEREISCPLTERSESDEIADWVLKISDSNQLGEIPLDEDPHKIDTMNRIIEMSPPTLDIFRMSAIHQEYMLSSLVYNLNLHSWMHTGSCFKASRATRSSTTCRYCFPRKQADISSVFGSNVEIQRSLSHEYINGYNPTIMKMFKCNHDIQVLFGGLDAVNRIYYCCKYVTKPQRQIDSTTAVALASFQRRQGREATELVSDNPPSLHQLQRRRVTSMIHTFTNKQEIAGPLAALYLFRGSCCYSSTKCARIPLTDILKQLMHTGDYTCNFVQTTSDQYTVYASASSLDDYVYRPDCTERLSLYEYTMLCYRRSLSDKISDDRRYRSLHSLATTHCVAFRKRGVVPVIKGPRLPCINDNTTQENRELHSKLAMVLFKPFRSLQDLLSISANETISWSTAYQRWEDQRSNFIIMIMNNMNDYHAGRDADENTDFRVEDDRDTESRLSSEYSVSDGGYDSYDISTCNYDDDQHSHTILATEHGRDDVPNFLSPVAYPQRIGDILFEFDEFSPFDNPCRLVACNYGSNELQSVPLHIAEMKKWVVCSASDSIDTTTSPITVTTGMERTTMVTEIIDDALASPNLMWEPTPVSSTNSERVPLFSNIASISKHFTLNELQHVAFALTATHLLRRWQMVSSEDTAPSLSDEEMHERQLRLILGGEGGTGKSRVIKSVQELCQSWCRSDSLLVTAMTGKAASIINGRTLASLEMSLKGQSCMLMRDIDCIIVDEVSMMAKDQLLKLDRLLRKAKRIGNVPFGGIHMILVGDFLQLPPIGADPLFIDPIHKTRVSLQDFEGFRLYRQFDKVVVLRESVRFKDDPEWGEGCSRARYGEWTPAFVNLINSRVLQNIHLSSQNAAIFVTPDNDTRTAINGHFISCIGKHLPTGHYPIRVLANFKGATDKLSTEDIRHIMGLSDTKFGRLAPFLDLVEGMPIQVTQNLRTGKGVANGTMGHLHSVKFPPGTEFRQVRDQRSKLTVLLPNKRPLYAILRLDRGRNAVPMAAGLPSDLFPVFHDTEAFSKSTIPLTPSASGEARSITVKIQQFPFVCAVGATVYKVQGESLRSMVVVDWRVAIRGANKPQQAYLMVSRVVTRFAIVSMKPFTLDIANWARPPQTAIEEDVRLAAESNETVHEFYLKISGTQNF